MKPLTFAILGRKMGLLWGYSRAVTYTQLKKLDKKKYAGNAQYDQIEQFLTTKLGL